MIPVVSSLFSVFVADAIDTVVSVFVADTFDSVFMKSDVRQEDNIIAANIAEINITAIFIVFDFFIFLPPKSIFFEI